MKNVKWRRTGRTKHDRKKERTGVDEQEEGREI